jgi:hypothetical protein
MANAAGKASHPYEEAEWESESDVVVVSALF